MCGQRLELVGCGDERQAGNRRHICRNLLTPALWRVQSGADSGAALRQRIDVQQRVLDPLDALFDLKGITAEFLT